MLAEAIDQTERVCKEVCLVGKKGKRKKECWNAAAAAYSANTWKCFNCGFARGIRSMCSNVYSKRQISIGIMTFNG